MLASRRILACLVLWWIAQGVAAEGTITVNAMNYPAWVVRDYQTIALSPGTELRAADLVRTGKGGRVLLEMADGSAVKLGEMARFNIETASLSDDLSVIEAGFQVLRGAFRFTSAFFQKTGTGHRVKVGIGAITAGVRGTDIWGRSNSEQDLVCLLEGAISVEAEGELPVEMDQPLSFYVKPQGQSALPIDTVDTERLQRWASETELDEEAGIARADGQWQLVVLSLTQLDNAEAELARFREQGFAVERRSVIRQGRTLHRLVLPGFVSVEAAVNARRQVSDLLGIDDAWVWRAG